ncbi:hypothetical protein ACROYT_G014679 [Oculina patagonica]
MTFIDQICLRYCKRKEATRGMCGNKGCDTLSKRSISSAPSLTFNSNEERKSGKHDLTLTSKRDILPKSKRLEVGTPMLAIIGTADEKTQSIIIKQLVLIHPWRPRGTSLSPFELNKVSSVPQPTLSRPVSPSDITDLQQELSEVIQIIIPTINVLSENISCGYGNNIVEDALVAKVNTTFTVIDVMEHILLLSINHALKLLEVFHKIFEDIPNLDIMAERFGGGRLLDSHLSTPVGIFIW